MAVKGAATIIQEKDLDPRSLADALGEWLRSRDELQVVAEKARELAQPRALERITAVCLQQAGGGRS
jgi:UDP-N-acetylglucosamine:LPS N-acetylglucosamine transferase